MDGCSRRPGHTEAERGGRGVAAGSWGSAFTPRVSQAGKQSRQTHTHTNVPMCEWAPNPRQSNDQAAHHPSNTLQPPNDDCRLCPPAPSCPPPTHSHKTPSASQSGAPPCVHDAEGPAGPVGVTTDPGVNPLQPEQTVSLTQLNKGRQLLVQTKEVALTAPAAAAAGSRKCRRQEMQQQQQAGYALGGKP